MVYNARLASHAEAAAAAPLSFTACDVSVSGDEASADCGAATAGAAPGWAFALRRDGAGWAIQSIVTR
jgi:hypothetical protein